jgi:hypothetical protein
VTWVKEAEATSTTMRRARRYRKTPYRQMRNNRAQGKLKLPPSTRARWGWKLRLCTWLARYFPIHVFIVEDIQAHTRKGKGRPWNQSFSPLEVGKDWFYYHLCRLAPVEIVPGHETAAERERLGLKKSRSKLSDKFEAHCVDSWVLANSMVGGHRQPDNTTLLYLAPLRFHRRQLHRMQPEQGGFASPTAAHAVWASNGVPGCNTKNTASAMSVGRLKVELVCTTCNPVSASPRTLNRKI